MEFVLQTWWRIFIWQLRQKADPEDDLSSKAGALHTKDFQNDSCCWSQAKTRNISHTTRVRSYHGSRSQSPGIGTAPSLLL